MIGIKSIDKDSIKEGDEVWYIPEHLVKEYLLDLVIKTTDTTPKINLDDLLIKGNKGYIINPFAKENHFFVRYESGVALTPIKNLYITIDVDDDNKKIIDYI